MPVTAPRCPLRRKRPTSATRSQTTTSPSAPPDARRDPSASHASVLMPFLCPLNVTSSLASAPGAHDHSRIAPSLYATANVAGHDAELSDGGGAAAR